MKSIGHSFFSVLQKIGKSLMTPVSVLPAAGLLVALGRMIQNISENDPQMTFVHAIGKICFDGGLAIFVQLPVVFAIGVAIGFANSAGVAGLSAAVGYFTMASVLKVLSSVRGLELEINTGVFGGIFMGFIAASLYNRYYQTKLHPVFGFFSGKRLVPIITTAAAIFIGIVLGFIWPPIQTAINHFGAYVMDSQLGPAFYAAGKRLLIPVGLHHVYYPPFLYEFGQFTTAAGSVVKGESARYFAGDPTAGRFMASEYPLMLFGLPAATLAMYLRAPKNRRKAIAGIMLSAALTSIITGITEPIEFSFIFVAPVLYVLHVAGGFLSGFLTGFFDIHLGYTFSASIIDYFLGLFNAKNSLYLFLIVGPVIAALYFFVFYILIGALDIKTPGREDESESDIVPTGPASEKAVEILKAIGGSSNIKNLDACITRLRLSLKDGALVNKDRLKQLGAAGVLDAGGGNFQIIFGVESEHLKDEMQKLAHAPTTVTLMSPLKGEIVKIDNVPDQVFSQKILGDGVAIRPSEGLVVSPLNAKVTQLFHTNHAIGLTTEDGLEVLIHIGIDTVEMGGRGFTAFVKTGDSVKAGQKLIEFDLELIRQNASSDITPIVITNMDLTSEVSVIAANSVSRGQALFTVTLK